MLKCPGLHWRHFHASSFRIRLLGMLGQRYRLFSYTLLWLGRVKHSKSCQCFRHTKMSNTLLCQVTIYQSTTWRTTLRMYFFFKQEWPHHLNNKTNKKSAKYLQYLYTNCIQCAKQFDTESVQAMAHSSPHRHTQDGAQPLRMWCQWDV